MPVTTSHQREQSASQSSGAAAASARSDSILLLNDRLRQTFTSGRVVVTAGVQALDDTLRAEVLGLVRAFDAFSPDNDPYGEHDFGRVVVGENGFFWKIDYYDIDLHCLSPDPADEAVTTRVLTIMREDEY
jgi:hypothetical protein